MINDCIYTFGLATTPWGGVKSSGLGRTHGKLGFLEVMDPIHINGDTSKNHYMWWIPYDATFANYMVNFKTLIKSLVIKE